MAGAYVYDTHNITWKNCTYNRNRSSASSGVGLIFTSANAALAGECIGIGEQPFIQDFDVVVENCVAENTSA